MSILDKINADKRIFVEAQKQKISMAALEKTGFFAMPSNSLCLALTSPNSSGIIAEFKRQSPSKGIINDQVSVEEVTTGYATNGAAGLSVLTDHPISVEISMIFIAHVRRILQRPCFEKIL